MIPRRLQILLDERLSQFPAVAVLGPRQVGKTTLVKTLAQRMAGIRDSLYLDLENPADLEKLSDPRAYLTLHQEALVIIDEIQRWPDLFQILRGVIDERIAMGRGTGQFVLLGSASIDLLKQSSESLAGRIAYLELAPFDICEVQAEKVNCLWNRGGFPRSFLAADESESLAWRENFVATHLERDIPLLGPRIPAQTLRRFWTMLAHSQGGLLNTAQLAGALGIDGKTAARYLDLMADLLLVRRLPPFHANLSKRLVKSPKIYVRDSGLLHLLLRLDSLDEVLGHPIAGASWEGFCIEQLINAAPPRSRFSFYRTATGTELDLVIELPGSKLWAVEIKRSSAPKLERSLITAREDIKPDKTFIVYGGTERYPEAEGVEAISLAEMAATLSGLERKPIIPTAEEADASGR